MFNKPATHPQIPIVTIKRRTVPLWEVILRALFILVGLASIVGGIMFSITLILLLPGLSAIFFGAVMVVMACQIGQPIDCPYCAKSMKVNAIQHGKNAKCESCKATIVLDWPKETQAEFNARMNAMFRIKKKPGA
ncbi:hypothetical protein ACE1TF_11930 [Geomicrobium sp. JSM 1781026]|uniref:hypothetical protein n=1 Tax=Geomicrobium sp. JSM 1781026 TaxID=3344580 RepID=UPI0035C14A16